MAFSARQLLLFLQLELDDGQFEWRVGNNGGIERVEKGAEHPLETDAC